ncbi:glutathione S-transferase family protein [Nannocystaceae bacterium ST9]
MTDPGVTLYHIGPSLFSQIVRLALAEKHVAYVSRVVDIGARMENYEPWYVRKNPAMVVPTLEVQGLEGEPPVIVTNAARIIVWIDENLHGPPLLPSDRDERAQVDEWIARQDGFRFREFSYGTMPGLLGKLAPRAVGKRIAVLERHRDHDPELAAIYQARIDDVRKWRDTIADRRQVDAIVDELGTLLADFEAQLEGHDFVVGDRYTLADVVWTVAIARMVMVRRSRQLGPRTKAWFERMRARPSWREADLWDRMRPGFVLAMLAKAMFGKRG